MPFNVLKSFKARKNQAVAEKTSDGPSEEIGWRQSPHSSPDGTSGARAGEKSPQNDVGSPTSSVFSSGDTKKGKGWASRVRSVLAVCLSCDITHHVRRV
jgi:hypothetical protein